MTILETGYKIIKKSADTHQNLIYKYVANKLFFLRLRKLNEAKLIGVLNPI